MEKYGNYLTSKCIVGFGWKLFVNVELPAVTDNVEEY